MSNEPFFIPLSYFYLNRILMLMIKMNIKHFYFKWEKIRAETGLFPLKAKPSIRSTGRGSYIFTVYRGHVSYCKFWIYWVGVNTPCPRAKKQKSLSQKSSFDFILWLHHIHCTFRFPTRTPSYITIVFRRKMSFSFIFLKTCRVSIVSCM